MDQDENRLAESAHTTQTATAPAESPRDGLARARSDVIALVGPTPERAFDRSLTFPEHLGRIDRRRQAALKAPPNTRKAWHHDWQLFRTFASEHSAAFRPTDIDLTSWVPIPAPPELLVAFVDYYSPATDEQLEVGAPLIKASDIRKPATLRRALATVSKAHRIHGLEDPTKDEMVRDATKAFFRGRGGQRQATPIHWDDVLAFQALEWPDVQRFLASVQDEATADQVRIALRGPGQLTRAKALLVMGYNTMARREELVAFDLNDVSFGKDGDGTAHIRRGKTDQEAEGHIRYLSPIAIDALRVWLDVAGIRSGPLFTQFQRNGQARLKNPDAPRARKGELPALLSYGKRISDNEINKTFKAAMLVIGKTPAEVEQISGHSTRVGASQDLLESGMDIGAIMQSGGWKDAKMPVRYTQHQQAKRSGMAKMMHDKLEGDDGHQRRPEKSSSSNGSRNDRPATKTSKEVVPKPFMPATIFAGHLSVGGVRIPFSGTAIADAGCRLTLDVDERPLAGDERVALYSISSKVGERVDYFSLQAHSPNGHQLHSDRVSLTRIGTDDIALALDEATVVLPLDQPAPHPRVRMWLRGIQNFGPTSASTPLGRAGLAADIQGVKPDDVSGCVELDATQSPNDPDWYDRAVKFLHFMRAGLALANGGRLHMPILEYFNGNSCEATFHVGRGAARELKVQHPLNQRAFFEALAARFFDPDPWPEVLWVAQGWMHAETTHDEIRFISSMTALEALIDALPKNKTKKRILRDKLRILFEHYRIRHDDLLPHVPDLVAERNKIVHRGVPQALTWKLIIVVREMITRIVLNELKYEGPYECYLGECHTREFPGCKAPGRLQ